MEKILRILFLLPGLFAVLMDLAKNGSRNIVNKRRFKDAIIDNGSSFDNNTILGKYSRVLSGCILNNTYVGSYSYLGRHCLVQNVRIGKFCSIANDVMIGLGTHPIDNFSTSPLFYRKKNTFNISIIDEDLDFEEYKITIIENDVWIGARVTILDGITIGNGAIVASGSVVTKNVSPYAIVGGVPAKVIKYRFNEAKIESLLKEEWWNNSIENIKKRTGTLNQM